jgi:putative redox protein
MYGFFSRLSLTTLNGRSQETLSGDLSFATATHGCLSSDFKTYAEKWLAGIEEINDPMKGLGTVRADSRLVGDQAQEASVRGYVLVCDEPGQLGGTDKGPSPLEFFVASVGFCENVTFARWAALRGLDFDSLETSVRGHWDRRGQGMVGSPGIEPSLKDFVVETRVSSRAPIDKIQEVARMTHARCPRHATLKKIGSVVDKLFVNGTEVQL